MGINKHQKVCVYLHPLDAKHFVSVCMMVMVCLFEDNIKGHKCMRIASARLLGPGSIKMLPLQSVKLICLHLYVCDRITFIELI